MVTSHEVVPLSTRVKRGPRGGGVVKGSQLIPGFAGLKKVIHRFLKKQQYKKTYDLSNLALQFQNQILIELMTSNNQSLIYESWFFPKPNRARQEKFMELLIFSNYIKNKKYLRDKSTIQDLQFQDL